MILRTATPAQVRDVHTALYCLRTAIKLLVRADCPQAAAAARRALKSADGARRHADRRAKQS